MPGHGGVCARIRGMVVLGTKVLVPGYEGVNAGLRGKGKRIVRWY